MRFLFSGGIAATAALVGGLAVWIFDPFTNLTTAKVERECGLSSSREPLSDECAMRVRAIGHLWSQKSKIAKALPWYERAAESRDAVAMFHLAWAYEQLGEQNLSQQWYESAAEEGFAPAMINLGDRTMHGTGTDQNRIEGLRWFVKASARANPIAGRNLFGHNGAGTGFTNHDDELRRWADRLERYELNPADLQSPTLERTRLMGKPVGSDIIVETRALTRIWAAIQKARESGSPSSVSGLIERPFRGVVDDNFRSPAVRLKGPGEQ